MKLVTFIHQGSTRPGVLVEQDVVDVSAAIDAGGSIPSLIQILEAGDAGLVRVEQCIASGAPRLPIESVKLTAPVLPRTFFAIGVNYADHIAEMDQPTPENLTVFYKAPTSTTGPYDPVERPAVSDWLDYEGELGIVIGKRCRHVSAGYAAEVIAGYLVVNDVSVRDWQIMTPQWSLGKSFDTHGPIGPYLVTPDEVGDPHTLGLRTYVNGDLRQNSNTSNLIFDCFDIVEILSQACTLQPGDVIASGTPSGVAAGMPGQPWLVPGDRVRVEIDRLGAIENEVIPEVVTDSFVVDPTWVGGRSRADSPEPVIDGGRRT